MFIWLWLFCAIIPVVIMGACCWFMLFIFPMELFMLFAILFPMAFPPELVFKSKPKALEFIDEAAVFIDCCLGGVACFAAFPPPFRSNPNAEPPDDAVFCTGFCVVLVAGCEPPISKPNAEVAGAAVLFALPLVWFPPFAPKREFKSPPLAALVDVLGGGCVPPVISANM